MAAPISTFNESIVFDLRAPEFHEPDEDFNAISQLRGHLQCLPVRGLCGFSEFHCQNTSVKISQCSESRFGEIDMLGSWCTTSTSIHNANENAFIEFIADYKMRKCPSEVDLAITGHLRSKNWKHFGRSVHPSSVRAAANESSYRSIRLENGQEVVLLQLVPIFHLPSSWDSVSRVLYTYRPR